MRLIYLSPVPWESFSQRPHKFVDWFHRRSNALILWVDPYPTRLPNLKDFLRSRSHVSDDMSSDRPPWLTVLKPKALPIEPLPGSGYVNRLFWRHHFGAVDRFANEGRALLAIGKPSIFAMELLQRYGRFPSLYDAMDDFPAFYAGLSRFAFARREREVVRRVGAMWVSSSGLRERWARCRDDIRLVHNGLDLRAIQLVERVPKSSGRKIFGYVGTMASWFDWHWVCELAKARANDEVQLIGPVFDRPPGRLPSNVTLLPACDHASALNFMAKFDVGLIPFRKNSLTAAVDPIKYYEYRALGVPVISTDFGEMSLRTKARCVFISRAATDIPAMANAALQCGGDVTVESAFASAHSWDSRFDGAALLL